MPVFNVLAMAVLGYLCGSLPFALWVTRWRTGVDVRSKGSGHATATNTIRQAGWTAGLLVGLLDLSKGFLPTWIALHVEGPGWLPAAAAIAAGSAAVMGHCWPLFGGFRGGMGLGTTGGAYLAVAPAAFLIVLAFLVAMLLLLRHAARAAMLTGLASPWLLWLFGMRGTILWLAGATGLVVALRFLADWNRRYRELWLDREKPTGPG